MNVKRERREGTIQRVEINAFLYLNPCSRPLMFTIKH